LADPVHDDASRLAVVIGGGNGIGAACCRLMRERGWRVAVVDLDAQAAQQVAGEIGGASYALDIRDASAVEALAERVEQERGPVAALVVSSGAFQERGAPEDLPLEAWRTIMQVNLDGTFFADRAFGTRMARRRKGSIVNIASSSAYGSSPLFAYGASKAGVVNLTRNLAGQWGRAGVRVNSVSPGPTIVPRQAKRAPGRYAADIERCLALGRRIQPPEIAEGVEFLASDRASAITGIDLLIDAGQITAATWALFGGIPPVDPPAGAP
jgi:NAD(P)-dependent dehydrogenase (short-subunit alcohol dehydrogenase family)